MNQQKENGVVFTPAWIAEFMIDEIFKNRKISGNEKILDTGCGEGIFTVLAAKKFAKISKKPIEKVISENIFFIDISKYHLKKTEQNLQKLCHKKSVKFNAICDDFCFYKFKSKFDFIIGNPPYVRIQNLENRRKKLQKNFLSAQNGSIDLYFCFFEQALNFLKPTGKISFITPNSHFYSRAGKNLRKILSPHLTKIINFDYHQVFENATAYTAISLLQKEKSDFCEFTENFKNDFDNLKFKKIKTKKLNNEKWEFLDENFLIELENLRRNHATLNEIADIHYGIATLKDNIFIFSPDNEDKKYFFRKNFKIEKKICVPIIKASTFKGNNQNLWCIFPYKNKKLILRKYFEKHFPEALKFFEAHRNILEDRDKGGGKNYPEIYSFGRSQGLGTSFGKKILTSTMNYKPKFFVVEDLQTTFFAGYCIKPKNGFDLNKLCEILNSQSMGKFIGAVSKSYRGGYKSYAKSFLKDFAHPQFERIQKTLF
ncbi:Eco57I restriction-modification methylase domain-containing protein [Candidatus Parcubacteria bacterium]|nr:Eco57I restriction-modification methylase domain-containing protein [Candidatus Parcubacteria bacterium]